MTKLRPAERDLMLDTLQRRQDYLQMIIASHLRWMQGTEDKNVRAIHRRLIDLLEMVAEQYDTLLHVLQKPR